MSDDGPLVESLTATTTPWEVVATLPRAHLFICGTTLT